MPIRVVEGGAVGLCDLYYHGHTVKKRLTIFPFPAGFETNQISLAGINLIIPGQKEFGISDIPAGDGKIANLFLQCSAR